MKKSSIRRPWASADVFTHSCLCRRRRWFWGRRDDLSATAWQPTHWAEHLPDDTSQPFTLRLQPPITHANCHLHSFTESALYFSFFLSSPLWLRTTFEEVSRVCHEECGTSAMLFYFVLNLWGNWGITIVAVFFSPQLRLYFFLCTFLYLTP